MTAVPPPLEAAGGVLQVSDRLYDIVLYEERDSAKLANEAKMDRLVRWTASGAASAGR
jgi:hypothetical protein